MIRPLFRYPGSKSKIINQLCAKILLNKNNNYIEPFFGTGVIGWNLLNKFNLFTFNDKDNDIYLLWHTIHHDSDYLKELILSFTPSTESYAYFLDCLEKQLLSNTEIAFMKLAIHQMSYSGLGTLSGPIGGWKQLGDYGIGCRYNSKLLCNKIDQYNNLMLGNKIILSNLDFSEIEYPDDCCVYLDPPYFRNSNQLYSIHFKNEDHIRLCNFLHSSSFQWLLSYDDCPEIKDIYNWANISEISFTYTLNSFTNNRRTELLICP